VEAQGVTQFVGTQGFDSLVGRKAGKAYMLPAFEDTVLARFALL